MLRRTLLAGAGLLALPVPASRPACAQVASRAQQGAQGSAGTVAVLYAASLAALMEHGVGPAWATATGGRMQGLAGTSNALAGQIKGRLRRGDVFISASPQVNDALTGAANGAWVRWFVVFAQSPLVIGYPPHGRFADALRSLPWYEALQQPGLRIGRTDPRLDPEGALGVQLLDRAERVYQRPGLARRVLGAPDNPAQVLPAAELTRRLQSGQLDVGFLYATEAADLQVPALPLPPLVSLAARYTVTVLERAPNPAAAAQFVAFLLGPQGRAAMATHGLDVTTPVLGGDATVVPPAVRAALGL